MVAQDEALTRIIQLNQKFDTVIVYPAFGNEVSKTNNLKLCELPDFIIGWIYVLLEKNVYEDFFSENNDPFNVNQKWPFSGLKCIFGGSQNQVGLEPEFWKAEFENLLLLLSINKK